MANWTGSLSHIGAMKSANPESGAYHRCDSVDSDIATYVKWYEMNDNNKVKTITRKQKAMQTPSTLPITSPSFNTSPWLRPKFKRDFEVGVLSMPLPSVHVEKVKGAEADMGIEMATITVPTLSFVVEPPKDVMKPEAVRIYPTVDRI
jgi:hypothetical protein